MRGLEARAQHALAKAIATFDKEEANDIFLDAGYLAECQGHADCIHGRGLPIMFRDSAYLTASWELGYSYQLGNQEMDECPHCQDDTGNPCHIHG